jgi:mannose-6-phosphate isomerase
MACSDNVVRAGLTPKLIDIPVLVDMLTYNYGYPKLMKPSSATALYKPPVKDFEVEVHVVGAGVAWSVPESQSPQIALLVDGTTDDLEPGACFFVPAGGTKDFQGKTELKIAVARAQV